MIEKIKAMEYGPIITKKRHFFQSSAALVLSIGLLYSQGSQSHSYILTNPRYLGNKFSGTTKLICQHGKEKGSRKSSHAHH